jgi:hypothetical protein
VHVFIPVEVLIWIRSLAIVLLIVAHALRHVQLEPEQPAAAVAAAPEPAPLVLTPELVDSLRTALAQITVSEELELQQALPSPQGERQTSESGHPEKTVQENVGENGDEQGANNYERVKAYLTGHPEAKVWDVAEALAISVSTANK